VLALRDARPLFGGLAVSATGSWAYSAGLLALVYGRTHSLGWVSAAGLVRFLPQLVISPYSGVVVERSDRFRLMLGTNALAALLQVALAVVAFAHGSVVFALACAMLTSICGTFERPAVGATIPTLVPERDLVAANTLQATVDNLTTVVGPALGAVILIAGSPGVVFLVNAASFAVAAAAVARVTHQTERIDVSEGGTVGLIKQMGVGLSAILGARSVFALVALCALVSGVYGTDTVLFVGVSAHKLGTGANGFGYLLAGLGVGGILMAAAVDRLAARPKLAWVIFGGVAGFTLPTALLIVIHSPVLAVLVEVFRGGSTLIVDVLALTALQRAVPSDRLGRVMGIFWAVIIGAIALGTLVASPIADVLGLNAALLVMAVGPVLVGLLVLPELLSNDRQTAAASAALAPRIALLEQLDMFATAKRPLLERLASQSEDRNFAPGTPIIVQGDHADSLYVLVEGTVEVTSSGTSGGPPMPIRTMTAPTYFGEIGILEGIARTANVTASSECKCALIDGATLLDALAESSASASLLESSRSRLALTHPSVRSEDEAVSVA
jgi:MFS family permease